MSSRSPDDKPHLQALVRDELQLQEVGRNALPVLPRGGGRGVASWEPWGEPPCNTTISALGSSGCKRESPEPGERQRSRAQHSSDSRGPPAPPRPQLSRRGGRPPSRRRGRAEGRPRSAPCATCAAAPTLLAWAHQGAKPFLPPQRPAVGLHPASRPRSPHSWGPRCSPPACGPAAHSMGSCTPHRRPQAALGIPAISSLRCPWLAVAASLAQSGRFLSVSQRLSQLFVHLVAQLENLSPLSFTCHSTSPASLARLTSTMKGHARVAGPALRCGVSLHLHAAVMASPHTSSSGWGAVGSPPPGQTPPCTPPHRTTMLCLHGEAAQ